MVRAFNAREGLTRKEDKLPKKFFRALQGEGKTAGKAVDEAEMGQVMDWYYEFAGWDKTTGNPTKETLKKLDLEWVL